MLPALPEIGEALGVASANDRQLVVILYMVGFAAGQLFFGPLSDHIGRKPALMAGLAIFIVGTAPPRSSLLWSARLRPTCSIRVQVPSTRP